jgi:hypothetical protein
MSRHERAFAKCNIWLTPHDPVFEKMKLVGGFDVDVAGPPPGCLSQVPAKRTIWRDSLLISSASFGFVWMNAPFNEDATHKIRRNGLVPWLTKFFKHANGIALVPDRTSAPWFREFAPQADVVLFVSPKIKFLSADGSPGRSPAQGSALFAIGELGCEALERASVNGLGILMRPVRQVAP